jgi:hypothetical protein
MADAPILSGVDLVRAERATRALVDALLEEMQMTLNDWIALNVTGTSGREMVARRIDHNRACLSVARKLCRRAFHILRELGDEALAPIEPAPTGER